MPSICTKPLTAGEVVIECKPLIHVLKTEFKGEYCDNCLQRSDSLKRCAKCLQMFYCDRNCQTFDWIQHKNECNLFRRNGIDLKIKNEMHILCIRFMLCIKNDKTFATKRHQLIDGSDVCLNDIEVKELLKTTEQKMIFGNFEDMFKGYGFDRKELLHGFGVFNSEYTFLPLIDYSKELKEVIGFGLCIQTGFISHSCLPNTAIVNNGLTLQVRAMKAIGSGEELTISYDVWAKTKSERQRISKKYSIDCKCLKCEHNLDSGLGLARMFGEVQRNLQTDPEHRGNLSIFEIKSYLTAIYGNYLPEKTLSLELLLRINHKVYTIHPIPVIKGFIDKIVEDLKEAIAITHGESHPLATSLYQLFAEY